MRVQDARQTFLGLWIKNVLSGDPITVFGDGSQLRDLTYVDDCVEAFLHAALRSEAHGKAMNIGGFGPISLRDLADILVDTNGAGLAERVPFPGDLRAIDVRGFYVDERPRPRAPRLDPEGTHPGRSSEDARVLRRPR